MTTEILTIAITASIRKHFKEAPIGLPLLWEQQAFDGEAKIQDQVQFLSQIDFPKRGSKNEAYAIVNITALVRTKDVPTDVFYHTRMKARVAAAMDQSIPVTKRGTEGWDKSSLGILRRVPTETLSLAPANVNVPDATVIEAFYEFLPC